MKLKYEILSKIIANAVAQQMEAIEINAYDAVSSTAIEILTDIQDVIQNDEISDFDAIEKIVCIFEKYNINSGRRHDFEQDK